MSKIRKSVLSGLISCFIILGGLSSMSVQAAMVSSGSAMAQLNTRYDRANLIAAINEKGVRDQLEALGVDPEQIEQRIQTLTPQELAQLNERIQNMPAGQGVVGVLLTVFIVFVITDLLCATNIFPFIHCLR